MGNTATFFIGFIATSLVAGKISSVIYERTIKKEMAKGDKK